MSHPPPQYQNGAALLFSLIIIGILLSAALTLSLIFTPKIKSSIQIRDSAGAFYAADTAVEWCLFVNRKGAIASPTMSNGATFTILPADCLSFPMTATGNYKGITRAVEVNF